MVLGIIRPTNGNFSWFGQDLDFSVKQRIGALLETPSFYPYLSARKNLEIIATIKEISNPNIDGVLETVGLLERADSKFKTYSLGMKQRLGIASAMLSDPEVMVLDEPTNGLDPEGIAEVRELIIDIAKRGITVIMASHILVEVEKVCTHVAVLKKGDLLFAGTAGEMTGTEGIIEVSSADTAKLRTALSGYKGIGDISEVEGHLSLKLTESVNPSDLNRFLAEKGIYVNHLSMRRSSLEKQFLNLLKNSNQ